MLIEDPGYFIEERVFDDVECDHLLGSLAGVMSTGRAGTRHLMGDPHVALLANDRRLLGIARRLLGEQALPYRATLFAKSAAQNWLVVWHQDTALPLVRRFDVAGWGPWSTKEGVTYAHAPTWALARILALRIHLDASTGENGPLRVLPGSHLSGVLDDATVAKKAKESAPVECLVGRGGVLGMSPLLIHASSKGRSDHPRRVLHIEYADSLDLAPGIRLAIA